MACDEANLRRRKKPKATIDVSEWGITAIDKMEALMREAVGECLGYILLGGEDGDESLFISIALDEPGIISASYTDIPPLDNLPRRRLDVIDMIRDMVEYAEDFDNPERNIKKWITHLERCHEILASGLAKIEKGKKHGV